MFSGYGGGEWKRRRCNGPKRHVSRRLGPLRRRRFHSPPPYPENISSSCNFQWVKKKNTRFKKKDSPVAQTTWNASFGPVTSSSPSVPSLALVPVVLVVLLSKLLWLLLSMLLLMLLSMSVSHVELWAGSDVWCVVPYLEIGAGTVYITLISPRNKHPVSLVVCIAYLPCYESASSNPSDDSFEYYIIFLLIIK